MPLQGLTVTLEKTKVKILKMCQAYLKNFFNVVRNPFIIWKPLSEYCQVCRSCLYS